MLYLIYGDIIRNYCLVLFVWAFSKEIGYHLQAYRCTPGTFMSGAKVNDRPIGYFFGEACHDFSLRERAKRSHTTQRRAGLPVRNRIG